jgi:hypothetical protein
MVLEIPAGPTALAIGFWYYPMEGGVKYAFVGISSDGNVERIFVPELLIDEHGHNTMVCHAKYTGPRVRTSYSGVRDDQLFFAGSFREERPIRDSKGHSVPLVDGSNSSVYVSISRSDDEIQIDTGGVRNWRGWERVSTFESYRYRRNSHDEWEYVSGEHSETEWIPIYDGDVGPWPAPSSHVGPTQPSYGVTLYAVDIGHLESYTPKSFPSPRHFFRFCEPQVVAGKMRWSKDVLHAFLEAHVDAMSRFPKQADNDIANSVEVGKMIAAALLGNEDDAIEYFAKAVALPTARSGKEAAKALGDMWMGYRYAYSTTKQDVQQRIDYLAREVLYNNTVPKCYGQSKVSNSDVEAVVRHSFRALPNEADLMSTIRRRLYEGGMMPSLYKGWDLVPFSFVCDWFGDIGNYLEGLESVHHAREYIYTESCYSLKYDLTVDVEDVQQSLQMYTRVYMLPPLDDDLWSYFDYSYKSSRGPTVKTKLKRTGDVGALTLNFL